MIPVVKSTNIRTSNTCRIARFPRATGGFSDVQESLASGGQLPLTLESLHAHTRSHYADYRLIGGGSKGEGGLRRDRIFPSRGLPQPSTITRIETNGRVVAVGDVHGDLLQTWRILTACGVLREGDNGEAVWCGGDTILVQCGDILDRGDHEIAIVLLLRELHHQAVEQGGAVYILNGNHESLNVCGDFRYVTAGGFVESSVCAGYDMVDVDGSWEGLLRSRVGLFRPGGPLARELAHNHTVLVINDTVFVHGGLVPEHVEYGLENLNQDVTDWMLGKLDSAGHLCGLPELAAGGQTSVMWNRAYSREYYPSLQDRLRACNLLEDTLKKVGCKRLVVGHTPQTRGINGECGGKVWRVDTGLSRGVLGGAVEGLEILPPHQQSGDIAVRIIKEM